ncbi:MAG TPA: acyl-ACP desaturase [Candidatus Sulfotelmatobacter sp.]|nr:acyl-ACP desaturase [Candidatus Sulfotelmatobacter sp.]
MNTGPNQLQFDVEKYVRNAKKVDISDLDLSQAANYPVSDDEVRALTYMCDIESHTIVYLRAILNTCAVEDAQTTSFLSCWAYEEFFHGHTIRQFLDAIGAPVSATRMLEVQKASSFTEWLKELGSSILCRFSRHFHGAYLTYGAISELSTLEGYGVMGRRTQNPILAEMVRRLAKDERRHFSFYYNKAKLQLQERNAQRLTSFVIRNFWLPVGGGVKPDSEVSWILSFVLGDPEGAEIASRIDTTIAKLPGLEWFDRLSRSRNEALREIEMRAANRVGEILCETDCARLAQMATSRLQGCPTRPSTHPA